MRTVGVDGDAPGALLPAIVHALAAMDDDIVLVLDDFHFIQEPICHEPGGVPGRPACPRRRTW